MGSKNSHSTAAVVTNTTPQRLSGLFERCRSGPLTKRNRGRDSFVLATGVTTFYSRFSKNTTENKCAQRRLSSNAPAAVPKPPPGTVLLQGAYKCNDVRGLGVGQFDGLHLAHTAGNL